MCPRAAVYDYEQLSNAFYAVYTAAYELRCPQEAWRNTLAADLAPLLLECSRLMQPLKLAVTLARFDNNAMLVSQALGSGLVGQMCCVLGLLTAATW